MLLRLAARGQIPLAHVDLVAEIAVLAAEHRACEAVNVTDSDLPDRLRFITALRASGWPKIVIPMPWQIFSGLGAFLGWWSARPGLLRRKVLHARMKPLGYDNTLMRSHFNFEERPPFEMMMKQAIRNE